MPHVCSPFAPPGRYLRLRPRGVLHPLPRGPALPAVAAPLRQHQPAPAAPGRLPLTHARRPPVLSASISICFQGPVGWEQPPHCPPASGPRSPRPHPKKSWGVGRGPPTGTASSPPRPLGLRKPPLAAPHRCSPPPSAFTYFFSLKILNQIFLHLVQPGERRCVSSVTKTRGIKGEIITHKKKNQTKNKKGRGVVLPVLLGVLMGMPPPGCRRTAEAASLRRGAQCGEPGVTFTGTGPSPWSPPSAHPLSFMCLGHRYWGEKERKKKKKRQKLYFFFFFSVLQITVKPFPSACPSSAWPLCPALQKKPRASQRDRAGRVSPNGSRCVSPNGMHHVSPDGKH